MLWPGKREGGRRASIFKVEKAMKHRRHVTDIVIECA